MSRARATALTLVNWRGVFFEHYWLDRHVTALEGANGAGKTTVMIAAYVVLLPDLARLRFVNLGETGATGGDRGIHGRLGDPGPSYSAIEIETGNGDRAIAGVYLERKAAPSLSLTPFLVSGLGPESSSHALFLDVVGDDEQVSSLAEIERKASASGLGFELFASAKDYFARLFERGMSPLRLATDEDRNKWNEMLRTSMTGGISRSLTSDLRSFLFKQESGLFDTLARMNKNLEACRRTRLEVSEARVLEQEISGIYVAGRSMFDAALEASRREAHEARENQSSAERTHAEEERAARELQVRLEEVLLLSEGLGPRIERARNAEASSRQRVSSVESALAAAERLATLEAERAQKEPSVRLALEQKAVASAERQRAKAAQAAARDTALRAASGLGSLQSGLEELHRQAHAHRQLRAQLERAREELDALAKLEPAKAQTISSELDPLRALLDRSLQAGGGSDPEPPDAWLSAHVELVRAARQGLDRRRAARDRELSVREERRAAHAQAKAALESLLGSPVTEDLARLARAELLRLGELERDAARRSELERDAARLNALAERQKALRSELAALGFEHLSSAAEFVRHLAELEASLRDTENQRRDAESTAARANADIQLARAHLEQTERRREPYRRLLRAVAALAAFGVTAPDTRAALSRELRALDDARQALRARAAELVSRSQSALAEASEHEALGGGMDRELMRLAELCEGQPLALRYDDLDVDEARRVEAELGPLVHAIVVDDPERAALDLLRDAGDGRDVWLLRGGASWPLPKSVELSQSPGADAARADGASSGQPAPRIVVDLGHGLRVSALKQSVTLGRAARLRRAETLRSEAESARLASVELEAREREAENARRELEALQEHWDVWAAGDPETAISDAQTRLETVARAEAEAAERARSLRLEAARLEARLKAVRAQLRDHHLLDTPELPAEAERAREAAARAERAGAELARSALARKTLQARIHDLDQPASEAQSSGCNDLDASDLDASDLDARRDRLFALGEALARASDSSAAWAWAGAERALAERTELVPELTAQHERAEADLARAAADVEAAEARWETATELAQRLSADLAALDAHVARARTELERHDVPHLGPEATAHAREQHARDSAFLAELLREQSQMEAEIALCRERALKAQQRVQALDRALATEKSRALPALEQWQRLADAALRAGALTAHGAATNPGGTAEPQAAAASAQRWIEARTRAELLGDRLHKARDGADLAAALRAFAASNPSAEERGTLYLQHWLDVQSWLSRRLPAPLSELGDPLSGLARLGSDLAELEQRLARQEGDLRGTSGDVAHSIEVQLRRASTQVRRLNRALDGVSFGNIHGIRVQMDRVEKMDRVLAALRDGATQELLFQTNLPIEAALDEIFRRHAGGRTGGQRLVDYREYLELSVQIQRQSDPSWQRVNPSQVSTGEAIGIGAALMMVILAEWERDDQLLRPARQHGSLRFLFLDEANRLSRDNLGVLFDLCETLDLQLLIAAPEVARAEGNTTYRLVRRVTEDGREEVLVTGRRATMPTLETSLTPAPSLDLRSTAPSETETPLRAPAPEQAQLFGE